MKARILDGRLVARKILDEIRGKFDTINMAQRLQPRIDIIKANNRPETAIYISRKLQAFKKIGFTAIVHDLSSSTLSETLSLISSLEHDPDCHGILVQAPVHFADTATAEKLSEFTSWIPPHKDVDGLNPLNLGKIGLKGTQPEFYPCTPLGIISLLKHYEIKMNGKRVAMLGRSEIVGLPMSLMFGREDATVTLCHSKTSSIEQIIGHSDICVAAIGAPKYVKAEWIKEDAVIIDVGINRLNDGSIVGDVDFDNIKHKAAFITPVPGGVGPLTVACLVKNTFVSACRAHGIHPEELHEITPN